MVFFSLAWLLHHCGEAACRVRYLSFPSCGIAWSTRESQYWHSSSEWARFYFVLGLMRGAHIHNGIPCTMTRIQTQALTVVISMLYHWAILLSPATIWSYCMYGPYVVCMFLFFLSAIVCPWLNFGLPSRCPQIVWCHWGEIEPFSATLAQDELAGCDQPGKDPLKYSAVAVSILM